MMVLVYRLGLIILFFIAVPFALLIGMALWVSSGRPILFRQKRVGKNGKIFVMYKFRTMHIGAEDKQKQLRRYNESDGPAFKMHNDPRYTRIGRFLSHTGLDELPQLWNVMDGDMALIGPRPLPLSESKKLAPWMRQREVVKPGLISPAILAGNYHKDFHTWMKSDVTYAKQKCFPVDLAIAVRIPSFVWRLLRSEMKRSVSRHA